jgi:hypothetical protein
MQDGSVHRKNLGTFDTPEEAGEAYRDHHKDDHVRLYVQAEADELLQQQQQQQRHEQQQQQQQHEHDQRQQATYRGDQHG